MTDQKFEIIKNSPSTPHFKMAYYSIGLGKTSFLQGQNNGMISFYI